MYRCSVFSNTNNFDKLNTRLLHLNYSKENFVNNLKFFKDIKHNKLIVKDANDKQELIILETPDTNKDRTSICCKYSQTEILKYNKDFKFEDFGFNFEKEIKSEGILYTNGKIFLEIIKIENLYNIHAYIIGNIPSNNEKTLSEECKKFEDLLIFIKPSLKLFKQTS
ncbi:hypothetical protein GVAV_000194 [Gurleya vavrai]